MHGKRSRKPKQEPNLSKDLPSVKKLRQDVDSTTPTSSKQSLVGKKPNGYCFQDVNILCNVISTSAVGKSRLKGNLHLFERPFGCGLARTLILQCSNSECHVFTELPTSEKIVRRKARFYDIKRSALAMRIIGRGRACLTKFCTVMNMPGPVAKKSFNTHMQVIALVSQQVVEIKMQKAVKEVQSNNGAQEGEIADIAVSCDGA